MQEDLAALEKWSSENNVKMNEDKFVLLCYNKNPNIVNHLTLKRLIIVQYYGILPTI